MYRQNASKELRQNGILCMVLLMLYFRLSELKKREDFFYHFVMEWVLHVKSIFDDRKANWNGIPGFHILVEAFVYRMKQIGDAMSKAMSETVVALLCVNPDVFLNLFMRMVFKRYSISCSILTLREQKYMK